MRNKGIYFIYINFIFLFFILITGCFNPAGNLLTTNDIVSEFLQDQSSNLGSGLSNAQDSMSSKKDANVPENSRKFKEQEGLIAKGFVGSGTQDDPYHISSQGYLVRLAKYVKSEKAIYEEYKDKYYILTKDITLDDSYKTSIGIKTQAFEGTFDGDGHAIIGNNTIIRGNGFFGFIQNATIKNLILSGINITNTFNNSGILVGKVKSGSIIENCGVMNGTITVATTPFITKDNIGGLVGNNYRGTIRNSYAIVSVVAGISGSYVGGLVGANYAGTIHNSYASGVVNGKFFVGGLVGVNKKGGTIRNSYASGTVYGSYRGGFMRVGGLVGGHYSGAITNSYWDNTINRDKNGYGTAGAGKSTQELRDTTAPANDIYVNWDTSVWDFGNNKQYPVLRNMPASGNEDVQKTVQSVL